MKKVLAAAGIGAAAIGSLVGAGTAQADTADENYRDLQVLAGQQRHHGMNTDVAISNGPTICAKLANRLHRL